MSTTAAGAFRLSRDQERAMPDSRFLVGVVGGAAALLVLGGLGTRLVSGTESTTELNQFDTVTVGGHKALAPDIVSGRTHSKYHPLPWVGVKVRAFCPTGLKAVTGTTIICKGKRNDGTTVDIPVTVTRVTDSHITWKFNR
ncbi:hypothetical protein AB5J56_39165 [Streptomyces sp. R21]|uniref:DUF4333 domain-containing protein n=1 Tax=Streptomyces sp. R21 TaxID=3238627 RepID=A0AB39PIF8_9ACTN